MKKISLSELDIFGRFLKAKGLSLTSQRKGVLFEVFKIHEHFEAEDLVDHLRNKKHRISRATVYRTLSHLEDCGLIRRIDLEHGHAHYEHVLGHKHHEHLYCEKCGRIVEFENPELEGLIRKIAKENSFLERTHKIKIFGLCARCKK